MGYFSNLAIEIEEAVYEGATPEQIAERLDLPVEDVIRFIEEMNEADRDPYAWD